jgi:cyanophycin synthetase
LSLFLKERSKHTGRIARCYSHLWLSLVTKPLNGNHGRGVTINISDDEQAYKGFETAQKISDDVIVERYIKGSDYRFLVINYQLEAVARRVSCHDRW